jgi:hypothetical protein
MRNAERNVGAVGVYYDGTTWWATFIATVDNTPPGGTGPKASAAPKPEPTQEAPPAPTTTHTPAQAPAEPASADGVEPQTSALPQGADTAVKAAEEAGLVPAIETEAHRDEPQAPTTFALPSASASDTRSSGYGWQELAAVAAVLALATSLLRRRLRAVSVPVYVPPDLLPPEPVARPERELVGAGSSYP